MAKNIKLSFTSVVVYHLSISYINGVDQGYNKSNFFAF
jgi:hypothetical protein